MPPRPTCSLCPLAKSRKHVCWGENYGPSTNPSIWVIGQNPGFEEDRSGHPFVGVSGEELRHALDINGITSRGVRLDNVCKCHSNSDRVPNSDEIAACTQAHLVPDFILNTPTHVIAAGAPATRLFLGDVNMDIVHGIPHSMEFEGIPVVVIPVYHPAAGLHDPSKMILFQRDMSVAADVIKGLIPPHPAVDEYPNPDYRLATLRDVERLCAERPEAVAVDTEWARGNPWCMSFTSTPGVSWVLKADQGLELFTLNALLNYTDTTTIIHNALYDIPVLAQMGVKPRRVADTMVVAYLLQDEPQGLKPLAKRHCGMEMSSYSEMVAPATQRMALEYLDVVMALDWPKPDPIIKWAKGVPKMVQPQDINRKVRQMLNKNPDDPYTKWTSMDGKEGVEAALGPMQVGELCDIEEDLAINYSARDADATIRIWPILWERLLATGQTDTFWRDMKAMQMVIDMMANGMPVNRESFAKLSVYFQSQMDKLQSQIEKSVGKFFPDTAINPNSSVQIGELVYDHLRLQDRGGSHRAKKAKTDRSTGIDILKRYVEYHPVVNQIIEYRGYSKLKSSYADAIPAMLSDDGRIRTSLKMTRTATGRLSSAEPNLMAQPVRNEEGRMVRDCYETDPDHVFLSGDYSQVEMRYAAADAEDVKMMQIFWEGVDIHSVTASEMFGVPICNIDEMKHRYPAKRVGFGILNLITGKGLQRELSTGGAGNWSLDDCEHMIEAWFKIYSGVAAYMKANGQHAKRYGYVVDMWGRRRYIPGIRSSNKWIRLDSERQAGNAPIQMGAQGIIKEAMGRLVPTYRRYGTALRPLIQIHDDIVWQVHLGVLDEIKPIIKSVMEDAAPPGFMVPLSVDFKSGRKWGSMSK